MSQKAFCKALNAEDAKLPYDNDSREEKRGMNTWPREYQEISISIITSTNQRRKSGNEA